jgi:hypothetical protein
MIYQTDKFALGISEKVATKVSRAWKSRKCSMCWQAICRQMQVNSFLKGPSPKKAGELLTLSRNQLRMTGLLIEHHHLQEHPFQLGLVDSPGHDRCKQALEIGSPILTSL